MPWQSARTQLFRALWHLVLPLGACITQLPVQEPDVAAKAAAVRAAVLLKMAPYLTPEAPPAKPPVPPQTPPEYRIGVLGTDAVTVMAQKQLPGKTVGTAKVTVVVIDPETAAAGRAAEHCDLLYIAGSVDERTRDVVAAQHATKPVPIVCESPGFAAAGGGVQLFVEDKNIRFEVNAEALKRQGVRASPQLLKLSRKGPSR